MRAQVLHQQHSDPAAALRLADVVQPAPGPGEVLVEVTASAVCRTDLQLVTGELPARRLPVIPGHQVVGRVTSIGDGVVEHRPGDVVGLVWLARSCGVCDLCVAGRENLCRDARFTGWDVDGGWADHVLAQADFVHAIPSDAAGPATSDAERDVAVAPLLCGGVIGYRSLRVAGIGPDSAGRRLGLFGFGASASLAIQVARHWDVRCFVITRSGAEVRRARELGAEWAGTYDESVPVALDAAITFAPAGAVVRDALKTLDRGGVLAINAIHLDEIPSIDYDDLWWERSIHSVANVTRADVREFLALVGPARVRTATEVMDLADAPTALQRLRAGDVTGAFVLLP